MRPPTSTSSRPTPSKQRWVALAVAAALTLGGSAIASSATAQAADSTPVRIDQAVVQTVGTYGPTVGNTVYLTFSGQAGASYTYQWLRDGSPLAAPAAIPLTADGALDVGQTAYQLTPSDVGHQLAGRIAGSATDFSANQVTTDAITVQPGSLTIQDLAITQDSSLAVGAGLGSTFTPVYFKVGDNQPTTTYQWLRNGQAIDGATSGSYTITAADVNQAISLQVTLTMTGYTTATATSASVTPTSGTMTVPTLTLDDDLMVGHQVTMEISNPNNYQLTWQWLRDGQAISGATSNSYTPQAADVGHAISVSLTVSAPGYTPVTGTSNAVQVQSNELVLEGLRIEGTAQTGQSLRAAWDQATGTSATYQWLRNGQAISGATSGSYVLTAADVNQQIAVQMTVSQTGYQSKSETSDAVTAQPGVITIASVSIPSTIKVGDQVTAGHGTVQYLSTLPAPTLTWQWLRDGQAISGATSSTYTTVQADQGHQLSAQLSAAIPGCTTAVKTSDPVTVANNPVSITDVTVSGTFKIGQTIGVSFTGMQGATYTYQWYRGDDPIAGATSQSYTLTDADQNHALQVKITGSKAGYDTTTVASQPVLIWDVQALLQPIIKMLLNWAAGLANLFPVLK